MLKPRRRVAVGITALAAAVSTIALAVPAQGIVIVPNWPVGQIPSGPNCAMSTSNHAGSVYDQHWEDTSTPVVTDVLLNGGTTLVVPPAGATRVLTAKIKAPCSGAGLALGLLLKNETGYTVPFFSPASSDVFAGSWTQSQAVTTDDVGYYRMGEMQVGRRYDSFILDSAFTYTSSVSSVATAIFVSGPWSLKKLYVLRAMTLAPKLSVAKIAKGKTVKATAVLKMATNAGYVADASDKVVVQTKVGAGKWISNATLTTNASGVVSYSFVLTATTQVRFVHNRVLSGKFTNAITSAIKTVTKA
jgi:hypothetical protein